MCLICINFLTPLNGLKLPEYNTSYASYVNIHKYNPQEILIIPGNHDICHALAYALKMIGMNRLAKYFMTEVIVYFALTLFCLGGLILLTQGLRIAGLIEPTTAGIRDLVFMFAYACIPLTGWLVFPAFITALLAAAGRMASANELTAMQAAGISSLRMSVYPVVMCLILLPVSLGLSLWAGPSAYVHMERYAMRLALNGAFSDVAASGRPREVVPGIWMHSRGRSGRFLKDVSILDRLKGHVRETTAERVRSGIDGNKIRLKLEKGKIFMPGSDSMISVEFDRAQWNIPVSVFSAGRWALFPEWMKLPPAELARKAEASDGIYTKVLHRRFAEPVAGFSAAVLSLAVFFSGFIRRRAAGFLSGGIIILSMHLLNRLGESLGPGSAGSWLGPLSAVLVIMVMAAYGFVSQKNIHTDRADASTT